MISFGESGPVKPKPVLRPKKSSRKEEDDVIAPTPDTSFGPKSSQNGAKSKDGGDEVSVPETVRPGSPPPESDISAAANSSDVCSLCLRAAVSEPATLRLCPACLDLLKAEQYIVYLIIDFFPKNCC